MNYIEDIMQRLSGLLADCPPDLLRVYALLALVTGERTSGEDVHHAWAAWRTVMNPDHPALVPFAELTPEVQALDEPYAEAIRKVAAERAEA